MRPLMLTLGLGVALSCLGSGCSGKQGSGDPPGKAPPRPVLPANADVKQVRIIPQVSLRPGEWPEGPLTQPERIGKVLDWLGKVDWSAHSFDINTADMPPVSQLIVERRDGPAMQFGLVDQGIIFGGWRWPADTEQLKAIFR